MFWGNTFEAQFFSLMFAISVTEKKSELLQPFITRKFLSHVISNNPNLGFYCRWHRRLSFDFKLYEWLKNLKT